MLSLPAKNGGPMCMFQFRDTFCKLLERGLITLLVVRYGKIEVQAHLLQVSTSAKPHVVAIPGRFLIINQI